MADLKSHILTIERQLSKIDPRAQLDEAKRLERKLARAKYNLYAFERDARNNNPIYREMITRQATRTDLDVLQKRLVGPDELLLDYLVGESGGYLIAVTHDAARVTTLEFDADVLSAWVFRPDR